MKPENHASLVAPALQDWWSQHGRKDLPWQRNPSRYRVWVSEIMLQQTQVTTVERYYDRFMEQFPDVADLAAAQQDEVLHLWSGLGYYARARNLHKAARIVVDQFDGRMPDSLEALESLPGIGRSTAGAILSLADNQGHAILDGNAKRVYARYFGIAGWPGQSRVMRELWQVAEACTPPDGAAVFTQAIMDLGAQVCGRRKPVCEQCPLHAECVARLSGSIEQIPGTKPKKAKPLRAVIIVMAVRDDGAVLLQKRPEQGIWGGLWSFPEVDRAEIVEDWCLRHVGQRPEQTRTRSIVRHSFTHFDLHMTPVEARLTSSDSRVMDGDGWLWYNLDEPAAVGLAAPVERLLDGIGEQK